MRGGTVEPLEGEQDGLGQATPPSTSRGDLSIVNDGHSFCTMRQAGCFAYPQITVPLFSGSFPNTVRLRSSYQVAPGFVLFVHFVCTAPIEPESEPDNSVREAKLT